MINPNPTVVISLAECFSDSHPENGDDMANATTDSADALTNLMNGVKEKWEELFGGLEGVLEFTTVCVGGAIGCLPSSFALYLIMLSVCVAVVAIFKALGGKDK